MCAVECVYVCVVCVGCVFGWCVVCVSGVYEPVVCVCSVCNMGLCVRVYVGFGYVWCLCVCMGVCVRFVCVVV